MPHVDRQLKRTMENLRAALPVRDADGNAPAADEVAIEIAATALIRWRDALEDPEAQVYALRCERALTEALRELALTPASRAKIGVELAQADDILGEIMREPRAPQMTIADELARLTEGQP